MKKNKIYSLAYIILISLLFLATWFFNLSDIFYYISLTLAFIPIFINCLKKIRNTEFGAEFFLTIATIIAIIGDQIEAITIILIIMLIAGYLEELIEEKTEKTLKSLIKLIPNKVILYNNGKELEIPINKLNPQNTIIVKTGNRIPADGYAIKGEASVNESALTGESRSIQKIKGDTVYAGTFIESGSLIIKISKIGSDTFFGKIMNLIKTSESQKAKASSLSDKVATWLIPSMLIFIISVWIITGNSKLTMTLLIFGSPLELTLVTPLSVLSGIIAAFRNGILVKGGLSLEKFSKANLLIFDKTGTLTKGEPTITNIKTIDKGIEENKLIEIAAMAEKYSGHNLAKAVLKKAAEKNILVPDPQKYKSISGQGISATYNNKEYFVGNKKFIESLEYSNINIPQKYATPSRPDATIFYIASSNTLLGSIEIIDMIRPEAKNAIKELKESGLKNIIIASGDKQITSKFIAKELGINEYHGDLLPNDKLELAKHFQNNNQIVAMVGDGINDAPVLKQANIGIALGAMGMEPAIEAADIVLMTNDISKIVYTYRLSKKVFKTIKQNIFIGFILVHGLGIILAFLGIITPIKAAIFHAIPDLLMLINSTRLINFK